MDVSQLPSVSGLLVTADNPARTDLLGMDHPRCAALHNYLVHYAWIAEGRTPASLHGNNNTFFTAHGAAAEALRPRLDPSLAAFLATAMLPPADAPEPAPFFFWASGLSEPDELFANQAADLFDEPADSLVCLYFPNIGQGGEFGGGLFYHQGCHRAAVFMHMDDYGYALPVEAHPELWYPLETVLSNWIDLVHLGKITASPRDAPALFGSEKIGPWEWRPYSEAQVAACVGAWDRLCDAIEARVLLLSPTSTTTNAVEPEPLLAPAILDAASVPEGCFARAFLTRARRPEFRCIAPGLLLPPADAPEFAAAQPFTRLSRAPQAIPPVCLFSTARGEREAALTGLSSLLCNGFWARSDDSPVPSPVPAGVYSESVERNVFDNAEEGFRLLLPYGLEGDVGDANAGARKSDGSFVRRGTTAELFQHGYKPFGGDYYRPQRLERLLDHWRKLVDDGVWSVGPEGVEGTIDTFREADTMHWRNYFIPPTWYNISTGDARVFTGDYTCYFNQAVCLPLPCEIDTVWDRPTCDELAQRYSNSAYNVTTNQFLSWNTNIQGSCSGIAPGQRVYKSAPGGTFPKPNATITAPGATGSPTYYTAATPAHPTQSGTISQCGNYYLVVAGDDCSTVDQRFGLNFSQLKEYNTYLTDDCLNLWLNYDVCVAPVTPQTVSTDGTCPAGVTCVGSAFGDCCSPYGFCGSGAGYCVNTNGTATQDGSCGPDHGGTTCTPQFGDCCSIYGFCAVFDAVQGATSEKTDWSRDKNLRACLVLARVRRGDMS